MEDRTRSLYRLLNQLERHDYRTRSDDIPPSGIEVFFEAGETIAARDGVIARVVRIGTQRTSGRMADRIRNHYGPVNSLGGNKNSSVFRKHVGGALLRRSDPDDPRLPAWMTQHGQSYKEIEDEVSRVMRAHFSYVCLGVPDDDERQPLVRGMIALLAQYPLGSPSDDWLGRFAHDPRIGEVGLWNVNRIDAPPLTEAQLRRIEALARGA